MASIQVRKSSAGEISYRVQIRLKGFPAQRATFKRKTDAKKWANATEADIRAGRYFKTAEAKKHTLAEMIDRYIGHVLPTKPKLQKDQTRQLNWWKDSLGHFLLSEITVARIIEARDVLAQGITVRNTIRSPGTVNRYLAALSSAFSEAVNSWEWLDDTPMRKVKKLKEPRGRVRFLSDDERERLLMTCKESTYRFLYFIVVLGLSTGMRKGEILNLKWSTNVDLLRGRLLLFDTKNNESRGVPLAGHALELLKDHSKIRRLDSDFLFPCKGKNPNKPFDIRVPWGKALKCAQIEDFRFHDLRHSAASYLAMNGATLAEIAEVLGHKTLQMVKRYAHLSEDHTLGVIESMNKKIFG